MVITTFSSDIEQVMEFYWIIAADNLYFLSIFFALLITRHLCRSVIVLVK